MNVHTSRISAQAFWSSASNTASCNRGLNARIAELSPPASISVGPAIRRGHRVKDSTHTEVPVKSQVPNAGRPIRQPALDFRSDGVVPAERPRAVRNTFVFAPELSKDVVGKELAQRRSTRARARTPARGRQAVSEQSRVTGDAPHGPRVLILDLAADITFAPVAAAAWRGCKRGAMNAGASRSTKTEGVDPERRGDLKPEQIVQTPLAIRSLEYVGKDESEIAVDRTRVRRMFQRLAGRERDDAQCAPRRYRAEAPRFDAAPAPDRESSHDEREAPRNE